MEIKGKINLFVNKKGEVVSYRGTLSNKRKDDTTYNCGISIRFTKEAIPQEKLDKLKENVCYKLVVEEGFLSCYEFVNKNGEAVRLPQLVVSKCHSDGQTPCQTSF